MRGVAILLVLAFHHRGWLSFGWTGVQLFFVLSGFLITGILLGQREQPIRDYLTRFYLRRTFRIFPPYYVYLLALGAAYVVLQTAPNVARYSAELVTYTINFSRARATFQDDVFISHLWSLGVEEQFYLVWPLLVYYASGRRLLPALLGAVVAGPLSRAATSFYLVHHHTGLAQVGRTIYVLPFNQLDAFGAGALAYVLRDRTAHIAGRLWIAVTCVTLPLVLAHVFPANMFGQLREVWGYSLLNLWFASSVLLGYHAHPLARPLSFGWLGYIGRVSYTMYLWHLALDHAFDTVGASLPRGVESALWFAALLGLSALSFHAFEQPLLRLRDRLVRPAGRVAPRARFERL